jgi:hypothetical protein
MTPVTQAEFARIMGVDRSMVTLWKQDGRLVLADGGLVMVDESKVRISETQGRRDDVTERHAAGRAAVPPPLQPADKPEPTPLDENSTAYWKREHQKELALAAKLERLKAEGTLIPFVEAVSIIEDIGHMFSSAAENLSHSVPPLLVGKDLDSIRAIHKQEVRNILGELSREMAGRIKQLRDGQGTS